MKYDLSRFTTAHQRDYQQALAEIRNRIEEKYDFKVSNLYIAQAKTAMGIKERENYNLPKSENNRQPVCPPEKMKAIQERRAHTNQCQSKTQAKRSE